MAVYVVSSIRPTARGCVLECRPKLLGALQFARNMYKILAISRYFKFAISGQEADRGDRGGLEAIAYVCPVALPHASAARRLNLRTIRLAHGLTLHVEILSQSPIFG